MTDHVIIDCDTPAGGGDISPAAADRSASLASRNLGEAAAVVEPPTPERAGDRRPRRAGRATRVHAVMEIDGSLTITQHRADGESKMFLTPGETRTLGDFLYDTKNLWA